MESKTSKVFLQTAKAWRESPRFVSSCGGTRSGKTFSNLQLLIYLASNDHKPTITSVVSETIPHLKRGAIRDFQAIWGDSWDDTRWNKTDCIYTFPNGSIIEFFSADSPAKVHGPARDRLFVNEAQNVPYEIARQLFVRTKDKIVIDYNPTHSFWANEKVEIQDNCVTIHSTYLDNVDEVSGQSFLTENQVAEIESNITDKNWWQVYGEGKIGTLDGLIYDFEQIDRLPQGIEASSLKESYGMDFGFTNDPTTLIHLLADTKRKVLYADELLYRTRMQNGDISAFLASINVGKAEIYADCAEPKSIAEIATDGHNIIACDKDAPVRSDKLKFQLQWMQGWKLYVTKSSVNLIKELRNYTWAKDKDGNLLNQPIDKYNHCLDALRYGAWSKYAQRAGEGQYSIRFSSH